MQYWILINANTNKVLAKVAGDKPNQLRDDLAIEHLAAVLIFDVSPSEYNEIQVGEIY